MWRYVRLFAYFLRFSFSRAMEFRVDFFFRIVMDGVFYAISILFFRVLYLHMPMLGGWNENQMMVFVAGFLIIDAISMTLFANNLWFLTMYVNRGDLDYYLVRPVSSLFVLSLRDFAANSFMNLVMTFGILGWALHGYGGSVTWGNVTLYVVMLANGAYLRYCVRMMTILPVFWLQSASGLETVFFHMARFVERPDRIYTGVARMLFTTALPFALMASFPARLMLEGFSWSVFGTVVGITVLFTVMLRIAWAAALRAYSSASS